MGVLSGRVAIVTGAASGIGAATAKLFASEGARVMVADVQDAAGEDVAGAIQAAGGDARYVHTDVSSEVDVEQLIGQTLDVYGQLDVLHNNAYWAPLNRSATDTSMDEWHKTIAVSLTGVFLGCRYALPIMVSQGRGVIINTASAAAIAGSPKFAAYMAAKGGVMALTRSVAYDYGKAGVRCNTICPGYIETPATAPLLSDSERKAWLMEKLLLPYTGLPADIANAALYLASDASRYMNGQVMTVDGGRTIS